MELIEAINQAKQTKRSTTFVFASKGRDINQKLNWLKERHGNANIAELVGVNDGK